MQCSVHRASVLHTVIQPLNLDPPNVDSVLECWWNDGGDRLAVLLLASVLALAEERASKEWLIADTTPLPYMW
jgi:hypothetical protein